LNRRETYLDWNATAPLRPEAAAAIAEALALGGNPSSVHQRGRAARRLVERSREAVATLVGASPDGVVFTSGGTEANHLALLGSGRERVLVSAVEHSSVLQAVPAVERIPVDGDGIVDPAALAAVLAEDPRPALVSVMLANNETGVIQPAAEIGRACRERGVHFHCDAVQAAGKIDVDVGDLACDTLALSAHKLHAPKGIGALYVRRGLTLAPHVVGGAQERRRRAGTENVPLAAAFGAAAKIAMDASWRPRIGALRDAFESQLRSSFDVAVNGASAPRVPTTSSVTFRGVDAEGLVIALDLNGIAVSTGSACSSGRVEPSGVLLAMGLSPEDAKSTVRFSMSRFTTEPEIRQVMTALRDLVPRCARQTV
jgi:cysteine desulfurase